MVKYIIPILALVFIPVAAGISFHVDVKEEADKSVKDITYNESIEDVQTISANVQNIGSLGCSYRFKANFRFENQSYSAFSNQEKLWQGASGELQLNYIPYNHTGQVRANLSIQYCGKNERIESFDFNVTEKTVNETRINTRTIESNSSNAILAVDEGDLLVPKDAPPLWNPTSGKIDEGRAVISYNPPIFSEAVALNYSVVEDGEVIGTANVVLEEEPSLFEKIRKRSFEIISSILGLSLLLNILLLIKSRGYGLQKVKSLKKHEFNLNNDED